MSDIHPKLKLKRKKSSADPDPCFPGTPRSVRPRAVSGFPQTESLGPLTAPAPAPAPAPAAAPASACSGASGDSLWARTLRWVLQELQDPPGQVPELPPPSAQTPLACSAAADWYLTDEVPPFPEYPSLQTCPDHMLDSSEPSLDTPLPPPTHLTPESPQVSPLQPPHGRMDRRTPRAKGGTGGTEGPQTAGGLMPSCPMCLLLFPLGFTQLDRDSHLAQCLSEVNIDVTW